MNNLFMLILSFWNFFARYKKQAIFIAVWFCNPEAMAKTKPDILKTVTYRHLLGIKAS